MEASAARLELDQKFDLPLGPRTEPQCFLPNPAQCHDPSKSKREKRRTMDAPRRSRRALAHRSGLTRAARLANWASGAREAARLISGAIMRPLFFTVIGRN